MNTTVKPFPSTKSFDSATNTVSTKQGLEELNDPPQNPSNWRYEGIDGFNAEGEQVIENAFKMGDRFASVGFVREDGDFELLATFNNNTEYLSDYDFYCIVTRAMRQIAKRGEITDLVALNTEYANDVVELDELSNYYRG